jgi:hypothetical protein
MYLQPEKHLVNCSGAMTPWFVILRDHRFAHLLLEDVPVAVRELMSFMLDGPSHFSRDVRDILNTYEYHNPRMGREGRTAWPPRSTDLDPITFYSWMLLKAIVCLASVPAHCKCLSRLSTTIPGSLNEFDSQDKTCPSMYWISRRTFWVLSFQCCNSEINDLKAHVYTTPTFFFWYVAFNPKVCPHISDSSYIAFILLNMSLCLRITS